MAFWQVPTNYLAVVVSALIAWGIGSLWYSPVLFSKQWMKLVGITEKDMEKARKNKTEMYKMFGISFLATLLTAYVMSHFVFYMHATTWLIGLKLAVWAWVGFFAAMLFLQYLYEKKPWKLFAINSGYILVIFVVTAVILSVWR